MVFLAFGDLLLFVFSLAGAIWIRQPHLLSAATLMSFSPVFFLWIGVLYVLGLYELRQIRDFVSLIQNLLISVVFCGFLGATYFYIREPSIHLVPKTILLLTVMMSHVLMLGWRRLVLYVCDYKLPNQRLVFLSDESHIQELEAAMVSYYQNIGYRTVRWSAQGADMIVVDTRWVEENWETAKDMLGRAISAGVPVVSLESFYEAVFGKVSPEYAGSLSWSLEFVLPKSRGFYPTFKRIFDLTAAAFLLVVLSPLMIGVSLAIALIDRVAPFYGQRRVGFLGQEFTLWKFRSMAVDADAAGPFTSCLEDDRRVTRLGKWLRRFRLDELPQLWNVLKGEMSLVGPRPEWVKEVEVLEKTVPHYHLRHLVPQGLTGWAQVYFRATNNHQDSIEKQHYDLYYLKYFSFALDFTILLKTLKRLFIKDQRIASSPAPRARFQVSRDRRRHTDFGAVIKRDPRLLQE